MHRSDNGTGHGMRASLQVLSCNNFSFLRNIDLTNDETDKSASMDCGKSLNLSVYAELPKFLSSELIGELHLLTGNRRWLHNEIRRLLVVERVLVIHELFDIGPIERACCATYLVMLKSQQFEVAAVLQGDDRKQKPKSTWKKPDVSVSRQLAFFCHES